MPPIVGVIAQFVIGAAIIVFAGVRLSRSDVIAEKSGAGGTWVGLTLLAAVTSLPELVSGASRILLFEAPDIAVGNANGACLFHSAGGDGGVRTHRTALNFMLFEQPHFIMERRMMLRITELAEGLNASRTQVR